ncbi:unnamed protein product [Rotaria sp. Silwood2]|nr:unnamed protein product [Rotaria sp. Silwood2]CAF4422263.1 unnamed protein product [Rotaria sp. Silwood2]
MPAPEMCSLTALSDSHDEGSDMGFGCFDDDMLTASYSAPQKMPAHEAWPLTAQLESDDADDEYSLDIFGDYTPATSYLISGEL